MSKSAIFILTLVAGGTLAFLLVDPIHRTRVNLVFLLCLVGLWLGTTALLWRRSTWLRFICLAIPVLAASPFFLPGHDVDPDALRADYLANVNRLEGTAYVWGGETGRGIDCSGLPRRAFRDALFQSGMRKANGKLLRAYLEHWWFDASAEALGKGYRQYTVPLGQEAVLRELDLVELLPGDIAVTASGAHALVYAGDGLWTQADPAIGVITLHGVRDQNAWFSKTVTTHRWRLLQP